MRSNNKLTIFLTLLITLVLTLLPIDKVSADDKSIIENIVNEQRQIINEIPINEIATKMYVTLIDDEKRVIATTNPNVEVNQSYYTDGSSEPIQTLSLEDNIYVLFEIPETIDSNLEKGIKDGVFYYLDLPDNIIPNEEHIIGSEKGPKEPTILTTDSKIKAVGGIYKNEDRYRFKIKFEDIADQIDVKATYQFSVNIKDDNILVEGNNKVNLDFKLPGNLDVYVNIPETPIEEEPEFDIKVNGIWEKSQDSFTNLADINAIWTIDITDNKEEPFNDKTLKLEFPGVCDTEAFLKDEPVENCMGSIFTQVTQNDQLPLKIYVDNKETTITRIGDNKWGVTLNEADLNNGKSPVAEIVLKNLNYNDETKSFTYSRDVFRGMDINFSKYMVDSFYGMEPSKLEAKNVKIVLDSTTFNVDNTRNFKLNAELYNNSDELEYSATGTVTKDYQNFEVSQGISLTEDNICLVDNSCPDEVTSNLLPSKLTYNIKTNGLAKAGHNYVEIDVDPNYRNEIGAYYYTDNFYKLNHETLEDVLENITIDGQKIEFQWISTMTPSFPRLAVQGYEYPELQMLVEQLEASTGCDVKKDSNIMFASKSKYDGIEYFLVVSANTYEKASTSSNRGYLNTMLNEDTFKPASWKIYILNTLGKEVEIEYTNDLGMLDIDTNELSKKEEKVIVNQVKVTNGENNTSDDTTFNFNLEKDIFTTTGKYLANNVIEWNLNTDYSIFMRDEMLKKISGNKWLNYAQIFGRFNNNLKTNYEGIYDQLMEMNFSIDPGDLATLKAYDYNQKAWISIQGYPTLDNNSTETSLTNIPGYDIYKSGWHNLYMDGRNLLQDGNIQKTRYLTYFKENNNDYLKNTSETRLNARALNSDVEFLEKNSPNYINSYLRHTTIIPTPKLRKSSVDTNTYISDNNVQITEQIWTVHADTEITDGENNETYYYNGHIDVSDDMSNSKIALVNKEEKEDLELNSTLDSLNSDEPNYNDEELVLENVKVGEYVYLTSLSAIYTANNQKYTVSFTQEELEAGKVTKSVNGVDITVTYNSNMDKGFNVAFDNLVDASDIDVEYNTEFDHEKFANALIASGQNISSKYKVLLTNNAYLPYTNIKAKPITTELQITLALAIDKYIEDYKEETQSEWDSYTKKYTVETTTGYSGVPYLDLDDSINRYLMIGNKANVIVPWQEDKESLKAIASSFELSDIVITMIDNGDEESATIIYENGQFVEDWNNSTFILSEDNEDGLLYTVRFENKDNLIKPGTTFRIEYVARLNMEHKLDNGETFRESDFYPVLGQRLYIDTLVNASVENLIDNVDGDNSESTPVEQAVGLYNTVTLELSDKLSVQGGAAGTYLKLPQGYKSLTGQLGTKLNWEYGIDLGTIGKDVTLSNEVIDIPMYEITNNISDEKKGIIRNLLCKYQSFSDIKVYYDNSLVLEHLGTLDNTITGEYIGKIIKLSINDDNNMVLDYSNFDLDSSFRVSYAIDVDIDKFKKEAQELGIMDELYRLIGDEENGLNFKTGNTLDTILEIEEEWGSKVIIKQADITKKVLNNNDNIDSTKWQISTNTESSDLDEVVIEDNLLVLTEDNLSSIIEKSLLINNFVIKLDGTVVYDESLENPYKDNFDSSNLNIVKNGLSFIVTIKNSDTNKVIGNNQTIVVEYTTSIDKNIYTELGGINKGKYSLDNKSILKDGNGVVDTSSASSLEYTIDIPISISKVSNGNQVDDISINNWNIVSYTKDSKRYNYTITDTMSIDNEYSKYMSLNNMVITLTKNNQTTEIYNSNNNILLPEGVHLYKNGTNEEFKFNELGNYNFSLIFDSIDSDTIVNITYSTSIDKDKYILDGNELDKKIDIKNDVVVTSKDGATATSNDVTSSASVPNKFTKSGRKVGYSELNLLPLIEWTIDVNLLTKYTKEELENTEVEVSDKLSASLKYYEDTLRVYNRITTPNGSSRGELLVLDEDYTFIIEDNTIIVKLLKPSINNNIEIVFRTECITTMNNLDNYATLTINGKTEEIKSESLENLIATNLSGTVSSTQIVTYNIVGMKYLDGKDSNIPFKFQAIEVDKDGNKVENGYTSIVNNDERGIIEFDRIRFSKEGTYYYEITELNEGSKKYTYDDKKYVLKIEVEKVKDQYLIKSEEIISPEDYSTITFANSSIIEDVPNTVDNIVKYLISVICSLTLIIVLIIGLIYNKKRRLVS